MMQAMSSTFATFRAPDQVLFGPETLELLGRVVMGHGGRAFICLDPVFADGPIERRIRASVEDAGGRLTVYSEGEPDFDVARVEDATAAAAAVEPTCIVGLGGGSTIDLAKLTAVRLAWPGPLSAYYGEHAVPGPCLPIVAIPTTAGTGSEVTTVAVVTDPARTLKVGVSSPWIMPAVAICDPVLLQSCPPRVTAFAGADALSHAIESATAAQRIAAPPGLLDQIFVGANPFTATLARSAAGRLARHLRTAVADGADPMAREQTLLGAVEAGMAFAQGGNGAAHALQYPLGAMTHTPHGLGVGLLLPYVMAFNEPARHLELSDLAAAMDVGQPASSTRQRARALIEWVVELFDAIGLPPSIADLGLRRSDLPRIARDGTGVTRLMANNGRPMSEAEALEVLEAAWDRDLDRAMGLAFAPPAGSADRLAGRGR